MKIGAQLYTVRDYCQSLDGLKETFHKVRGIGYEYAQMSAWNAEIPAADIREAADAAGLRLALTHFNPDRVLAETDAVIDFHDTIGAGYIGIGSLPGKYERTADGIKRFCADYAPAAEKIMGAGLRFMYHNHAFEFAKYDGKSMFRLIGEGIPAGGFVVDVYWAAFAGVDPAALICDYESRVDTIHLKDMKIVAGGQWAGNQQMCEVGEGNLNWEGSIFKACDFAGVKYAFVEQDDCFGVDPFVCLKTSFDNLKEMGVC